MTDEKLPRSGYGRDVKASRSRAYASLLRWLGPWAKDKDRPTSVDRHVIAVPVGEPGDRPFEAWMFSPRDREPFGAYVLCPGLHYEGPMDPRLSRFAEILANAGILVLAPFLPDFLALRVDRRVIDDLDRAVSTLALDPRMPKDILPGIFSISFGSLPSLSVAARRSDVGAVVVFGGYANFETTVRFSLGFDHEGKRIDGKRDPLNQPVVFINLVEELVEDPSERVTLVGA